MSVEIKLIYDKILCPPGKHTVTYSIGNELSDVSGEKQRQKPKFRVDDGDQAFSVKVELSISSDLCRDMYHSGIKSDTKILLSLMIPTTSLIDSCIDNKQGQGFYYLSPKY